MGKKIKIAVQCMHKQLPEPAGQLPVHRNQQECESECPSICWRKLGKHY